MTKIFRRNIYATISKAFPVFMSKLPKITVPCNFVGAIFANYGLFYAFSQVSHKEVSIREMRNEDAN